MKQYNLEIKWNGSICHSLMFKLINRNLRRYGFRKEGEEWSETETLKERLKEEYILPKSYSLWNEEKGERNTVSLIRIHNVREENLYYYLRGLEDIQEEFKHLIDFDWIYLER